MIRSYAGVFAGTCITCNAVDQLNEVTLANMGYRTQMLVLFEGEEIQVSGFAVSCLIFSHSIRSTVLRVFSGWWIVVSKFQIHFSDDSSISPFSHLAPNYPQCVNWFWALICKQGCHMSELLTCGLVICHVCTRASSKALIATITFTLLPYYI